ncbi:PREDICTED: uncharacterized protein LOC104798983 [Tarenaya hassleriana]|uniref:uncharacterized protein LOC104798983 n=1 Tax=Tarenaya hassleriana TaxID=28532 RepID=UPI00053C810E|nr:PREDICTED: uncharacterized protein LOC104798983 [Tarenaya hassleriana]
MSSDPPPPQRHIGNRRSTSASALPDLLLTAVSLLFLFASPKPLLSQAPNKLSFPLNPRRRFTGMSRPRSPLPQAPPLVRRFASPQSLSDWLETRLPSDSFAAWGVKPGTKNVHNLWLELADGETSLADSIPPIRNVNVVTVRVIGKDGRILVESHQELSDGSIRERFRPLSEKMKPDETPEEAVFRAVKEELGSIFINDGSGKENTGEGKMSIFPGSYSRRVEERNSVSYPGLPAIYVLHSVDATVEGLPDGDFCTEETEYGGEAEEGTRAAAGKAVTVKRHHWKWVSPDLVQP